MNCTFVQAKKKKEQKQGGAFILALKDRAFCLLVYGKRRTHSTENITTSKGKASARAPFNRQGNHMVCRSLVVLFGRTEAPVYV